MVPFVKIQPVPATDLLNILALSGYILGLENVRENVQILRCQWGRVRYAFMLEFEGSKFASGADVLILWHLVLFWFEDFVKTMVSLFHEMSIACQYYYVTCVYLCTVSFFSLRRLPRLLEISSCGDRILLVYEPGLDFLDAFIGSLLSCRTAVPVYPPVPTQASSVQKFTAIQADCGAKAKLSDEGQTFWCLIGVTEQLFCALKCIFPISHHHSCLPSQFESHVRWKTLEGESVIKCEHDSFRSCVESFCLLHLAPLSTGGCLDQLQILVVDRCFYQCWLAWNLLEGDEQLESSVHKSMKTAQEFMKFFWYQLFSPDFFLAASVFFCVLYGFGIYLFFSVMFLYVSFSVFLVFFCWPIFWLLLGLLACFWVFLFPLVALCARFVLFGFLRCAKDNGAEAHIGQMRS